MPSTLRLAVSLLALSLVPTLWAQPDPAKRALREFENEFSGGGVQQTEEYLSSKRRWAEWEALIEQESRRQASLVQQGGRALKDAISTYQGHASLRGRAVDHYLAGRILGMTDQYEAARDQFERALQADKYFYWANHALGTYFVKKEMHEAAAGQYKRALDVNGTHFESARALAFCLHQLKQYDRAEILLRELLKHSPDDLELHRLLASVLISKGDHAAACPCLETYLASQPDDLAATDVLAKCYERSGQEEKGLALYDTYLARHPSNWRVWILKGNLYLKLNRPHDCADCFEAALQHLPADNEGREKLANDIKELRTYPANPVGRKRPELSKGQILNDLKNSADVERRRRAARMLYHADFFDRELLLAFLEALTDRTKDPIVRVYALKFIDKFIPKSELHEYFTPTLRLLLEDPQRDYRVQGMVAYLAGKSGNVVMVPPLIEALDARHPYVFRQVHDALNKLTYAYVRVDLKGTLDPSTMDSLRAEWLDWWERNRSRYAN